jgi:hypothetical protein
MKLTPKVTQKSMSKPLTKVKLGLEKFADHINGLVGWEGGWLGKQVQV